MNWKELLEKLNAKRAELAAIFEKAKTKVDGQDRYNLTTEQLEDVKARNAEIDDLAKQVEEAQAVDEIYQKNVEAMRQSQRAAQQLPLKSGQPAGAAPQPAQIKSLGETFIESDAYKNRSNPRSI